MVVLNKVLLLILLIFNSYTNLYSQLKDSNSLHYNLFVNGMSIWPKNDSISRKPHILIQLQHFDDEVAKKIFNSKKLYLKSENHKVKLRLIHYYDSKSNLIQAKFITSKKLKIDQEYDLVYLGRNDTIKNDFTTILLYDFLDFEDGGSLSYFFSKKISHPKNWKVYHFDKILKNVSTKLDTIKYYKYGKPNSLINNPKFNELIYFKIDFCSIANNLLFEVKIREEDSKKNTKFYCVPQKNMLILGRANRTFGNYLFKEKTNYILQINLIDSYGNRVLKNNIEKYLSIP